MIAMEPGRRAPRLQPGDRSVLLHIGVHKTGTTALQATLAARRQGMEAHGVCYPGTDRAQHLAVRGALRKPWGWREKREDVEVGPWRSLLREVAAAPDRAVISSEFLGEASAQEAQDVVGAFGNRRVVVLVVLRPLVDLTPSSYQQFLKYGMKRSYEEWLHNVLPYDGKARGRPFWMRNDHGAVIERWASAVGPDNVVVVVLDPDDRDLLFREVARLLCLPELLLVADRPAVLNRSMTAAESALVRGLNLAYRGSRDWDWYDRYVRRGLARALVEKREPGPDEPMLVTPGWAQEQIAAIARDSNRRIVRSAVSVVGDLSRLEPPVDRDATCPDPGGLNLPVAACALAVRGLADRIPGGRARQPLAKPTIRRRVARRLSRASLRLRFLASPELKRPSRSQDA